jgi:hypothetical protein
MRTLKFWSIIESTGRGAGPDRRRQVRSIQKLLQALDFDELASFANHLDDFLAKAYTFDLMIAAFTVYSYLSDDTFLDFRAWLVLQGRSRFEKAVANPDTVADLVSKREVDDMHCGAFSELPTRVWLDRGGNLKLYAKKIGFMENPIVKQNWPKDRQQFKQRYPVLYKAFWNPGRIKAMSGG